MRSSREGSSLIFCTLVHCPVSEFNSLYDAFQQQSTVVLKIQIVFSFWLSISFSSPLTCHLSVYLSLLQSLYLLDTWPSKSIEIKNEIWKLVVVARVCTAGNAASLQRVQISRFTPTYTVAYWWRGVYEKKTPNSNSLPLRLPSSSTSEPWRTLRVAESIKPVAGFHSESTEGICPRMYIHTI